MEIISDWSGKLEGRGDIIVTWSEILICLEVIYKSLPFWPAYIIGPLKIDMPHGRMDEKEAIYEIKAFLKNLTYNDFLTSWEI